MKYIILTGQNVKDLVKHGTLTVEKKLPPAAYEHGETVSIREPWYRTTHPNGGESNRYLYAADVTVEQPTYKWASPVAMPAEAIRHYARVTGVIDRAETKGQSVVTMQEITVEYISKAQIENAPPAAENTEAAEMGETPAEPSDEEKAAITEETFDALAELAGNERKQEIEARLAEIKPRLDTLADILRDKEEFTAEAVEEAAAEQKELAEESSELEKELATINGEPCQEKNLPDDEETPLNYQSRVSVAALSALRTKVSRLIVAGDPAAAKPEITGILKAAAIQASSDITINAIDATTLRKIVLSYGGDDNLEGGGVLLLKDGQHHVFECEIAQAPGVE